MKNLKTFLAVLGIAFFAGHAHAQDIFQAVKSKNPARVKELIEKDISIVNTKDESGQAPLHWACLDTDMAVLNILIEKGADLNAPGLRGQRPLHYTIVQNHYEACQMLLSKGADPTIKDTAGKTPLDYAAEWGYAQISELLLDHGGTYNAGDRALRMIRISASGGLMRLFKVAMEKGGESAFSDEADNKVTMKSALEGGSAEIIGILLSKNIPIPRDADVYGWTPIHYAADKGNLDLLALLAEKGVDLNARTKDGESAYNIAQRRGHPEALALIAKLGGSTDPQKFPLLKGPYFGQKPPDVNPEVFAPEILAKPKQAHSNIAFSADGKEAYWCHNGIYFSRIENGFWTTPRLVPFSTEEFGDDAPFVSPDGRKLYFSSKRPLEASDRSKKENYWMVDILKNGWSEPKPLPPVINARKLHWQITADMDGNICFGYESPEYIKNQRDIFYSEYKDGAYQLPHMISERVNGEHFDTNPFISPAGDYLIFARRNNKNRADGSQDIGLFISYKLKNKTWSPPIDLRNHIRFQSASNCPIVSRDGKYLFFLDFYERNYQRFWVSATFIEDLRPKE